MSDNAKPSAIKRVKDYLDLGHQVIYIDYETIDGERVDNDPMPSASDFAFDHMPPINKYPVNEDGIKATVWLVHPDFVEQARKDKKNLPDLNDTFKQIFLHEEILKDGPEQKKEWNDQEARAAEEGKASQSAGIVPGNTADTATTATGFGDGSAAQEPAGPEMAAGEPVSDNRQGRPDDQIPAEPDTESNIGRAKEV